MPDLEQPVGVIIESRRNNEEADRDPIPLGAGFDRAVEDTAGLLFQILRLTPQDLFRGGIG
jgi:hypothetical protein